MKSNVEAIEPQNFRDEYRLFVTQYLCPLLGLPKNRVRIKYIKEKLCTSRVQKEYIAAKNKYIVYFSAGDRCYFALDDCNIPDDNINLAEMIIEVFLKVAQHRYDSTSKKQNTAFLSETCRQDIYRGAIEKGIYRWIVNRSSDPNVDKFFSILDKWSVKTYEGKPVSFGFLIHPYEEENDPLPAPILSVNKWLNFLDNDISAVFTDCIHSVIELDYNCNFVKYRSITDEPKTPHTLPECKLSSQIPLRFTQIIQNHVTGKTVGVFLLNNSDIVLAKKQKILFVKRNRQWLNISYESFQNSLKKLTLQEKVANKLFPEIFASVLDVSFSHTGGIIAVCTKDRYNNAGSRFELNQIVGKYDNLLVDTAECSPAITNRKKNESEEKDIFETKRKVIQTLVGTTPFYDIDRKLRSELIGLDGACILNAEGMPVAFGAIIENDPGSTGGARKAAAVKLSKLGMAVKISTDGYIEIFIEGKCQYAIK